VAGLRALARHLPDESGPAQAAAAVTAIHTALTALLGDSDADADNVEVQRFMEAVSHGGAHLRLLTPRVQDWMRRHGLEDSFRIGAGRPASE